MALVSAKCTKCGEYLQLDDAKKSRLCPHCGKRIIVEKAVQHYADELLADEDDLSEQEDDARYCTKCGSKCLPSAQFCGICGNRLSVSWQAINQRSVEMTSRTRSMNTAFPFFPQAILSLIGLLAFWFPWIRVQIIGIGSSLSGSDLAQQETLLYIIPLYCLVTLICLGLVHLQMLEASRLKAIVGVGLLFIVLGASYSYYEITHITAQASEQLNALFGKSLVTSMQKSLAPILQNMFSFTLWFYLEIAAILAMAIAILVKDLR